MQGDGLSPKHRIFVNSMLAGKTETQAAIDAKYSARSAHVTACRLLKKAKIKAAIEAGKDKAEEKAIVSVSWVLEKLKVIAEVCGKKVVDDVGNEKIIDSNGANGAIRMVGQHLAMFTDKVEVGMSDALAEKLSRAESRNGVKENDR